MTFEEAKRIVRLEDALEFCKKQSMLEQYVAHEEWKHYSIAVDAIKKQIPQKPINKRREIVCPTCRTLVGSRPYCGYCGQMLDHSTHPTEKGGAE